jgi:hypothetical protein
MPYLITFCNHAKHSAPIQLALCPVLHSMPTFPTFYTDLLGAC